MSRLLLILMLINGIIGGKKRTMYNGNCKNVITGEIIDEIQSHETMINQMIEKVVNGSLKGTTWQELATFVDKFGPRFSGTKALEDSIDYVLNKSISFGFDNVHGEVTKIPHWVRGAESATLLEPRIKDIAILGLGYSVGTPKDGITAQAIVVNSFDELKRKAKQVSGKIVVYNEKYISYDKTVRYRESGASEAAKLGAVAVLIKSVSPVSLYTPHTGMQSYEGNVKKIPAACITAEDAALLSRIQMRGDSIMINLKMEGKNYPDVESRNVVAEIIGREKPESVVVLSGHIDSWDVGQGAMDDGGGAFISWNALQLLKIMEYKPRRTIRMIMWTAEEMGCIGAQNYIKQHTAEESGLQFVMESDSGTFMPLGLMFTGSETVQCVLQEIMKVVKKSLGEMILATPDEGPDIYYWTHRSGIPGASLWNKNEKYFWYHHTNADTMLVEDPAALDRNTALFAAVALVLADLSIDLPRHTKID